MNNSQASPRETLVMIVSAISAVTTGIATVSLFDRSAFFLTHYVLATKEASPVIGVIAGTSLPVIVFFLSGAVAGAVARLISHDHKWLMGVITGVAVSTYSITSWDTYDVPLPPVLLRAVPFLVVALIVTVGTGLGARWMDARLHPRRQALQ